MKNLHFKAMNGQMAVDEAQGIVECFVAAIGNKDSVGDIIVPGAFESSFRKRKPRVVWGHDWNQPIGKVIEIYEVGPRDPRLPGKMKTAGVGGVFAKVQFNLNSERGREAFANVLFFGEEQEWSIGYKTLDAVWDPNTQANVLRELELYEVSPVLHGANQLTATISIKDAKGADSGDEVTSLRDSKWDTFDIAWAKKLQDEHPDIWAKGGNIKGNDQWRILTQIAAKGKATTQAELNALKLREAWIARHKGDFRLPGVIAQIKWLAVGTRGEDYMKNVVREAIDRKDEKGYPGDGIYGKAGSVMGVRAGAFVRWDSSGGTAYGKVLKVAKGGTIAAKPAGPSMRGTEDNPAVEVQVWKFRNGSWDETDTVTVHRFDALQPVDTLPKAKAAPGAAKLQDLAEALGDRIPTGSNLVPDVLPQERVTGDVLRGYGPRRGNLEKLLRYWRPIMRKPGGFRRCRVILADHPELYPLDNLCAWLHHETTGLWPNEGCHHPGMKNCRRKLKKAGRVVSGSLWSDSEFDNRLRKLGKGKKDGWGEEFEDEPMTPYEHWMHEMGESGDHEHEEHEAEEHEDDEEMMLRFGEALREFAKREPEFMEYLADDDNWAHEGQEHDEDDWHEHVPLVPMGKVGCGCGGGCGKSADHDDISVKAGRTLSSRNHTRLTDAIQLIKSVIDEGRTTTRQQEVQVPVTVKVDDVHGLVSDISPVLRHHGVSVKVVGDTMSFSDPIRDEAAEAIALALENLGYDSKGFLRRIGRAFGGGRGGRGGRGPGLPGGPRPEPIDPNAEDGDNDGMVQDGTTAERPAALDRAADIVGNHLDGGLDMESTVSQLMGLTGKKPNRDEVEEMIGLVLRARKNDVSRAEKGRLVDAGLWELVRPSADRPTGRLPKPITTGRVTPADIADDHFAGGADMEDAVRGIMRLSGSNPDDAEVADMIDLIQQARENSISREDKARLLDADLWELVRPSSSMPAGRPVDRGREETAPEMHDREDKDFVDRLNAYDIEGVMKPHVITGYNDELFTDEVGGSLAVDKRGRRGVVTSVGDSGDYISITWSDGEVEYINDTFDARLKDVDFYYLNDEDDLKEHFVAKEEYDGKAQDAFSRAVVQGDMKPLEDIRDSIPKVVYDRYAAEAERRISRGKPGAGKKKPRKAEVGSTPKPDSSIIKRINGGKDNRWNYGRRGTIMSDSDWQDFTADQKTFGSVRQMMNDVAKAVEEGDTKKALGLMARVQDDIAWGRRQGADVPEWQEYLDGLEAELRTAGSGIADDPSSIETVDAFVKAANEAPGDAREVADTLLDWDRGGRGKPVSIEQSDWQLETSRSMDPQDSNPIYVNGAFVSDELHGHVVVDNEKDKIGIVEWVSEADSEDDGAGSVWVQWFTKGGRFDPTGSEQVSGEDIDDGKFTVYPPNDKVTDLYEDGKHMSLEWEDGARYQLVRDARALYGADPDAALDLIYSLKDRLPAASYEALLRAFRVSVGLDTATKSLRTGRHNEWLRPVVAHHGIPYEVKDGRVRYDLTGCTPDTARAFDVAFKRAYDEQRRSDFADRGWALPDGSFPIRDAADLRNAIHAYGRAKDKPKAKAHIIKRARALKRTSLLPEGWT